MAKQNVISQDVTDRIKKATQSLRDALNNNTNSMHDNLKVIERVKLDMANLTLQIAIEKKDKREILRVYDYVRDIDMDNIGDKALLDEYDLLVDQANDILYS